jgi:hypothetical protein
VPQISPAEIVVWLATIGVIVGIPVALLVFVFRLGQRHRPGKP